MSRRSMPYHRRYHGDALNGYMPLSLEERGAYTTILDLIYDEGGPILDNRRWLAGFLGCSLRKVEALLSALVEKGKLYLTTDGRISNKRAEKELEYSVNLSRINAEKRLKSRDKSRESSEKTNKNSKTWEQQLNRSSIIPDPEPDIIDSSEYDAVRGRELETAGAGISPIRQETFTHETAATRLLRSQTPPVHIGQDNGRRLTDALDRKVQSRWPVPPRTPRR